VSSASSVAMELNLIFTEDVTKREKINYKKQGSQDRALGDSCGGRN